MSKHTAQQLAIIGENRPINELLASESEQYLREVAHLFTRKAARIKQERQKKIRDANLEPWKDEAKRWTPGQHVYFGDRWCYSEIDIFNSCRFKEGADIAEGQRAKVYQTGHRNGVWLELPKSVQTAHKQKDGRNLQWIGWHDIMRHKVSRLPIKDRPADFRPTAKVE